MAEETKSAEMPKSLYVFLLGTMIGATGAAVLAGPGGLLLFCGLAIMVVAAVSAFQELK